MPATGFPFPGRDHLISLAEAIALTTRHRDAVPAGPRALLFDRGAVDAILGQAGCAGLRIYHGRRQDGGATLVIVGADAAGSDLCFPRPGTRRR